MKKKVLIVAANYYQNISNGLINSAKNILVKSPFQKRPVQSKSA